MKIRMASRIWVLVFSLCTLSGGVLAQEPAFDGHTWVAPYNLPTPEGWGFERFPIPIGFAPEIAYKGVEDIRFAPGWSKPQSPEYWSYAFLWYLDGDIELDSERIESDLKAYYTGLVKVNGANIPTEKLVPVITSFREVKKDDDDLMTFAGSVEMTDYMSKKPIALNCKVHLRKCPGVNRTFVFFELSPQPSTSQVWRSLDDLWVNFKCT